MKWAPQKPRECTALGLIIQKPGQKGKVSVLLFEAMPFCRKEQKKGKKDGKALMVKGEGYCCTCSQRKFNSEKSSKAHLGVPIIE